MIAELLRRELAATESEARQLVDDHRVRVGGAVATKATRQVSAAEPVTVVDPPARYVSRAGLKLEGALDAFTVDPSGRFAVDVGSSTGGFTDCLLARGAAGVLAVDVGRNQLHERLLGDPRVEVRERTDVRHLTRADVPAGSDLVTVDVSFISLVPLAPHLVTLAGDAADLVVLVKPQFEATRREADRGSGVITDPAIWQRVLTEVTGAFAAAGAGMMGAMASPLRGASGNVEFLTHLRTATPGGTSD